ncbi:bifunctional DNA primase/polymerase [Nonomuraea wenchangensis]
MRDKDRWVRYSKKKVPLQTHRKVASSTDPATWTSYARAKRSKVGVGLGFVLNGDGIVCVDLDHCIEDGVVASWARDILDRIPRTYVEVSPSGTGLHVFGLGRVTVGRRIRRGDGTRIEVYGTGRFIAVTGSRFESAPSKLADLSKVLADLT